MKKQTELIKNTLIIFLGKISTQFMSFILLPLYTYQLNVSEFGIYDILITYINLIVIFLTLQLEQALFRFLIDKRKDFKESSIIITNIFIIILVQIVIFIILVISLGLIFSIDYSFLFAVVVIITSLNSVLLQISRGFGKNILYSKSCAINGVLTIFFSFFFLVLLDFRIQGLLLASILSNTISFVYMVCKLKIKYYFKIELVNRSASKLYLNYSIPLIPNIVSWWIINVSDRTIITLFLNAAANGIYAVSNKFPMIISSLYSIFNMSWTESVSLHIKDNDAKYYIESVINFIFNLAAVLCLIVIIFSSNIIHIFIDQAFYESTQYIPILVLGAFFNIVIGLYSAIYIALKYTKKIMNTSIIAAIINLIINVCLIKFIQLYAAAISTTVAYFIMMIYRYYDINKLIPIKLNKKNVFIIFLFYVYFFIDYYTIKNNVIMNIFMISALSFILFKKNIIAILKNLI